MMIRIVKKRMKSAWADVFPKFEVNIEGGAKRYKVLKGLRGSPASNLMVFVSRKTIVQSKELARRISKRRTSDEEEEEKKTTSFFFISAAFDIQEKQ